jgi:hypothetical protein
LFWAIHGSTGLGVVGRKKGCFHGPNQNNNQNKEWGWHGF